MYPIWTGVFLILNSENVLFCIFMFVIYFCGFWDSIYHSVFRQFALHPVPSRAGSAFICRDMIVEITVKLTAVIELNVTACRPVALTTAPGKCIVSSQSRSVSSWPICPTTATIGWVCTPLSLWWSLSSAGPTSDCRRCHLSGSQRNTSRSSLRRETPCGRSGHSSFFSFFFFNQSCLKYRNLMIDSLIRTEHFSFLKCIFERNSD